MREDPGRAQAERERRRERARRFVAATLLFLVASAVLLVWSTWLQARRRQAVEVFKIAGAVVRYESSCPEWFLDVFGETAAYAFFPKRVVAISTGPSGTEQQPSSTQVTDENLKFLHRLTRLESLDLRGSQVTDEGLLNLTTLKRLEHLDLHNTRVTELGVASLERALPNLEIER